MFIFSRCFDNKTLRKAVAVFGERKQEDIAIEEMSELIKALIKNRRYNNHETRANVLEEMADVYIMLCQLFIIHGFDETIVDEKINRLVQRMEIEIAGKAGIPHYRCVKCGTPITKEEVITGCKVCDPK